MKSHGRPTVAIVGSGIVGTTLAYHLTQAGHVVDVFENGPDVPYPHAAQFEADVLLANRFSRAPGPGRWAPVAGVRGLTQAGDYGGNIEAERKMCVGGQATVWAGITPRLHPTTFRTRSLHGYGSDWPIDYEELEPYYARAEGYLAISGSHDDNPFAGRRSSPYPLPAFAPSWQDLRLAEKLRAANIVTHTTPQARTRTAHEGRPGCQNFGACPTCPIGARYSPNYHMAIALASGRLTLHTNASVRRVIMDGARARGIVYHPDNAASAREHGADIVIVAAGAIESARLLLLSASTGTHASGIGNASGQVGRNLSFHHVWFGHMDFSAPMYPGRIGPPTLASHQFVAPEGPRRGGGMAVELFDSPSGVHIDPVLAGSWRSGAEIVEALRPLLNCRVLNFHAETTPGPGKYLTLSTARDRFGDPFAHVQYTLDAFDHETYASVLGVAERVSKVLGAESHYVVPVEQFWSAHHHLGTCRMGADASDSVVDAFGAVHQAQNLFVCGGSTFVGPGALQPTLTMVALAIRTADFIAAHG